MHGDDGPAIRRRIGGIWQGVEHRLEPCIQDGRGIHRVRGRVAAGQGEEVSVLAGSRRSVWPRRSSTSSDARTGRPCSSQVYQVTLTPRAAPPPSGLSSE